jgi:hypothetical protein
MSTLGKIASRIGWLTVGIHFLGMRVMSEKDTRKEPNDHARNHKNRGY